MQKRKEKNKKKSYTNITVQSNRTYQWISDYFSRCLNYLAHRPACDLFWNNHKTPKLLEFQDSPTHMYTHTLCVFPCPCPCPPPPPPYPHPPRISHVLSSEDSDTSSQSYRMWHHLPSCLLKLQLRNCAKILLLTFGFFSISLHKTW